MADDIGDWSKTDKVKVEAAFRRGCKTGAGAGAASKAPAVEATLSALKKFLPKENYDNIQVSFAKYARDKKYLSSNKFVTQEFFIAMCRGDVEKAKKLVAKLAKNEDDAAAKEAAPKKEKDDVTKRLTDSKNYTGAHKERFSEDGKGKGLDGRVDKVSSTGYVGEYKGDGTFKGAK